MRVKPSDKTFAKPVLVPLLALMLLAHSPSIIAKQKNSDLDWAAVQALPPGTKVVVKDKGRQSTRGRIVSVAADALTLQDKQTSRTFDRQQIARIQLDDAKSLGRSTLVGLGIGAGSGAATAGILLAIGGTEDFNVPALVGIISAIGAGVGTVGGLINGLFSRRTLIYESR